MLTKLVEKQTPESMCQHLPDVMPGLLKVILIKLVIQVMCLKGMCLVI